MQPVVTEQVVWSVGLSVTLVSPAKTAEPIEMPFRLRTWVGSGNHVSDGSPVVIVTVVVVIRAAVAADLLVSVLFCSLAVLDPRVGHTMDVLSPFISILCHSD